MNKYKNSLFFLIVFLGCLLFDFNEELIKDTWIMNFQTRDIHRSFDLFNGKPIFFGPETTNGANLPGPFFYILLLPAMLFVNSWLAAWWWMLILACASAAIAASFLQKRFSHFGSLLFICAFLLMPNANTYYKINVNPSYLFIFVVSALVFAIKSFSSEDDPNKNKYFWAACLVIGLGIQLHFSIIFMFAALIVLQMLSRKLRIQKLSNKAFISGILIFIAPSIPYFVWLTLRKFGIFIGQETSYTGVSPEATSTYLYLIKNSLQMDFGLMISSFAIDFLRVVPLSFFLIPFIYIKLDQQTRELIKSDQNYNRTFEYTKILIVFISVCTIPYMLNIFIKLAHRYGMAFHIASLFMMVCFLYQIKNIPGLQKRFITITGVSIIFLSTIFISFYGFRPLVEYINYRMIALIFVFIVILLTAYKTQKISKIYGFTLVMTVFLILVQAALVEINYKNLNSISSGGTRVNRSAWITIFSKVYAMTGWDYTEAKHRLYVINAHDNNDLEPVYNDAIKLVEKLKGEEIRGRIKPDGIVIAVGVNTPDLESWMLSEPIHEDIKKAIKLGHIRFETNKADTHKGPRILMAPYFVNNTEFIPKSFHSNGLYYKRDDYFDLLNKQTSSEIVYVGTKKETVFQWNECPDKHPFCNTAAFVNFVSNEGQTEVNVRIVGESLSQASVWIHQSWTAAWNNPYIEIKCGDKIERRIISSSIGYKREYLKYDKTNFFSSNNSMIAPFEKSFQFNCKQPIQKISIGRESSTIDFLTGTKKLDGKVLTKVF